MDKTAKARKVDRLRKQCKECRLYKPHAKTADCRIRVNLVVNDSPVAWQNQHLFFNGDECKHFVDKKGW